MNMDIPVTLVIKAPNQKYNDQTISCFSDWTVEKLKAHLSHVYPSKPSSKDQRLVYSGRLLSDDLQLKDVFRKQDEYHMIHLVCASRTPPPSPQPRKRSSRNKTQAAATDTHTRPASAGTTTTTTSPAPPTGPPCDVPVQPTAAHSPLNTTAHPAFTQGYPWPQVPIATAGPASGPLLPISPMSLFWWQQAYAWHLYTHYQASLAAYYQTARPLQPDSQPEQPNEQQQQQQQQQQRLAEAAGGEGPEEEDVHRDWLDWVYTGSRAVGLLSIIYFYSSFSRFLMVLIGMVMLYLHQAGWLPFNLVNELQDLADLGNQEELDADLNDLHDMERVMDDGVGDDDSDSSEDGSEGGGGGGGGGGVIDEQNGFLSSAWGFITTFFTSLIPEAAGVPNAAN